ncbi:enoyl-CoA hydratase/isomerase family protein [Gordonia jinghuaiqii]|uniref:Enoyl-CoA hydratase/isomerase family protein n=1 Tax=Gordonia jinghuaiqii TaxID=2758710 RepID=A0A7D7LXL8_9ACTN|nr:enoyl-CoA hydratase/isomerase family protein [Gordonia jinghuaiqii]MCR5978309.1 enoyl-CoA hydratase/isomerase family protein [Gordonia jinghuaiqii]QMT01254.1 enoyl-CoA hydratase/isomerase family protein [Gordonia jinghuaiqii]
MTVDASTETDRPPLVRADHDGPVTTVTLANPDLANALTYGAMKQFIDALRSAHTQGSLLLVVRAEGDDFCIGRDQKEKVPGVTKAQSLGLILEANTALRDFPGVSVCVIRGRAFGFGSGVAVQSDLTIAADTATLGFDEVRHGLAPLVVAEYLPELIGPRAASDLVYTGREVSAREALSIGLVSRVVAEAELDAEAQRLVDGLVNTEPGALRLLKSYSTRLRAGAITNPRSSAVAELDAWLTAGRPEYPSPPSG